MKRGFENCKHADSPAFKKFKTQPSAQKIMATIYWDNEGILMINYIPKNTTLNGKYFANLIYRLREEIKAKRRGKLAAGIWLLHDNAPVHNADVSIDAIRACGFKKLSILPTVRTGS